MCLENIQAEQMEESMSNSNKAGDTKGAIAAFLIIAFAMVATPIIIGTSMGWFNLFGILGF